MKLSRFLMVSVLTAWVLSPALSAASIPAVVPAPQRMKVNGGAYSLKAKRIYGSLYSFKDDSSLPREGYGLVVTEKGIAVTAADAAGRFYAEQTLRQLLSEKDGTLTFPCVEISDSPSFGWRGALLDEGRHFFGKEFCGEFCGDRPFGENCRES